MTTCRGCRSTRLDPVFEMEPMPLAGSFAATREAALTAEKYPLTWLLCADCGLVNVEPDIPDELIYSTYSYAASTVPGLVRHHAEFAATLRACYRGPVRLLEIGCNDGVLLNQLPPSWERVGVDPSDVARAQPHDYDLVPEPFTSDLPLGEFDVITSSNSFAHFTAIADAFDGVARFLRPGGDFWIEVHDLDATLLSGQWDTIYHEHKVEWDLLSLQNNLEARGLRIAQTWRLPLHGGLLRVRAVHGKAEWWRETPTLPGNFRSLQGAYDRRQSPPLPAGSWAYGAAARASVYLNQVRPDIEAVTDGSPLRHGRFIPGTGTPIYSPAQFENAGPPATLITAWNHADDIQAAHPSYHQWVTAW